MRPLIYTNALYLGIFCFILVCWSILERLGPRKWPGSHETPTQDRGSLAVLAWLFFVGASGYFLYPLWFSWSAIEWNPPAIFFIGVALVILGGGLRWYAIKTLGCYFTTVIAISRNHQVVQHGPYRYIRHPSYTGVLIMGIGMGLMMGNGVSVCFLLAGILTGLLYRISVEEKALCRFIGNAYIQYMQRVHSKLIPFIF